MNEACNWCELTPATEDLAKKREKAMLSSNVKTTGLKFVATLALAVVTGVMTLGTPAPAHAQVPGYVLQIRNETPNVVVYDISFDGGVSWTPQSIGPGGFLDYNTGPYTIWIRYYHGGFNIFQQDLPINRALIWNFRPVLGGTAVEAFPD
jgi:hypothetical protein